MNTKLSDKLGIHAGMRIFWHGIPEDVQAELEDIDEFATIVHDAEIANLFLYFVSTRKQLHHLAEKFRHMQAPQQILWVAWPKQSSKLRTDISEQDLRDILLPIGLVDTKVCSISDDYSGLKFVWRKHQEHHESKK